MSVRLINLAMCAGLVALAAGAQAQTAPQTHPASAIQLAQAVTPPPAVAPAKTKKSKTKKPAGGKAGAGTASPPQPELPDRSKY